MLVYLINDGESPHPVHAQRSCSQEPCHWQFPFNLRLWGEARGMSEVTGRYLCCSKPLYAPQPNILGRTSRLPPHISMPGVLTHCTAWEFCPLAGRSELAGQKEERRQKGRNVWIRFRAHSIHLMAPSHLREPSVRFLMQEQVRA